MQHIFFGTLKPQGIMGMPCISVCQYELTAFNAANRIYLNISIHIQSRTSKYINF